jgi:hypothetical protein
MTSKYYIYGHSLIHANGSNSKLMRLTRPEPSHQQDVPHMMRWAFSFSTLGSIRNNTACFTTRDRAMDLAMQAVLFVGSQFNAEMTLGADLAPQFRRYG